MSLIHYRGSNTTRRFPRTMAETNPAQVAQWIEHYPPPERPLIRGGAAFIAALCIAVLAVFVPWPWLGA